MHVGMEMAEAHEEARDELGGGEEGEAHRRLLGAFHFLDLPLGAVQLVHNALCVAQEDLPVAGEDDIPAAPLEKRDAQIISSVLMVRDSEGCEMCSSSATRVRCCFSAVF